jgi:hypothetical protein
MKEERDAAMTRKQSQPAPPAELAARIEQQRQDAEELRKALQEANSGERTKVSKHAQQATGGNGEAAMQALMLLAVLAFGVTMAGAESFENFQPGEQG